MDSKFTFIDEYDGPHTRLLALDVKAMDSWSERIGYATGVLAAKTVLEAMSLQGKALRSLGAVAHRAGVPRGKSN
ncbi:MAG: hypothetical protein R3B12_03245 [Candidatus Saccharimonadales bacterium]